MVFDESKHVLVAFVTDWCEYCEQVEEAYRNMKVNLIDPGNLILATYNYDKNELMVPIKSFPTLYLYKIGYKDKPIEYKGSL